MGIFMHKTVSSPEQQSLLMPAWVMSAVSANDRLIQYLALLQCAGPHVLPGRLLEALATDLFIMARPVCVGVRETSPDLVARRDMWLRRLHRIGGCAALSHESLAQLMREDRDSCASFQGLVMDLQKQLGAMASAIASESLDGAQVWQIENDDRPLVQAFMRGLRRTAPSGFSHPGLDTAVMRDGARLLIRNGIGMNDVHELEIAVEQRAVNLSYAGIDRGRFDFFCQMLEEIGFQWTVFDPVTSDGLDGGKPYLVGQAILKVEGQNLLDSLEAVASSIVFVIDWHRTGKRHACMSCAEGSCSGACPPPPS
jgi:hypothetical protein